MGFAPLLVDTYRTYKNGTSNFVQWLAETARATGTVNNIFKDNHQEAVPPAGGRLKCAARKEAKKAGLTQNATATCQIPAKSSLTLATAIAGDTHASVPLSVFTKLRAVIEGRRDCAVWHQYFIKVVENVLEILRAKQPQAQHRPLKTDKTGPAHSTNMYELLQDKELSDSGGMPEVIESPVRPTKGKVTYKLEASDTDREFAKGEIDLQAAAQTMNAAIAIIEALSNEFEQANPRFKDTAEVYMHVEIVNFTNFGYGKSGEGSAFIDVGDEDSDPFTYKEGNQMLRADTDMQRELGSRLSAGELLLQKSAHQLSAYYQVYLDVEGLEDVGKTHKLYRHGMEERQIYIDALNETQKQEMFDELKQQAHWKLGSIPDFSLLKCDPALCGLYVAGIRDEYHRTTVDIAYNQGQILFTAHLYHAAKSTGYLPKDL
ncbi:hypothetical protein BKA58DRAFT_449234 [Alternaria rosae]|uniref:uncharacterized protein n=1 Tax=Alternaria rosae TaxID=1187941 RepID=UPI001E8E170C|nr:uncharacterized protein BKA58DRAFT_449234 [Alternaria rosae]KAH6858891.1 hypothetical protein BKA58DRAFT_449234 [Alternaria rosae]